MYREVQVCTERYSCVQIGTDVRGGGGGGGGGGVIIYSVLMKNA